MNQKYIKNLNKIKYKGIILLLIITLFVGVDVISYKLNVHSSVFVQLVEKYYFVPTLTKTQNFYKTYKTPLQTDEFVMLLWLWPDRAYSVKKAFDKDPFYRIYRNNWKMDNFSIVRRANSRDEVRELIKMFGVNTPLYAIDEKIKNIFTDPTDDVVLKALYCDKSGYDDFDYELLKIIRDKKGGYGDTHYLLSLLFLEKLECVNWNKIVQDKQSVIHDILAAESKKQVFSDLFVERIVVLYWAGKGDKIKFKWIKKVVKNIQKNGGWKDKNTKNSDPHATGLAALSIKYFLENKNLQDILIQK
jgi:hypothetical protein